MTELSGRRVTYGYDDIYRLTSETIAGAAQQNGTIGYVYDLVGNRKTLTSTVAAIPAGVMNYDANDRISTDVSDNNGNNLGAGGTENVYDFENHLVQKGDISIVYDGDGNRVSKIKGVLTTNYLVDTNNPTGYAQVLEEIQDTHVVRSYSYGLDLISQTQKLDDGSWQLSFYGYDGHGSVRYLTNPDGNVTDTYDYDAFGNLINSTGATPNNYLYAGEQFDPDLGLYYNRARYLDVRTARFWGMDPWEGDTQSPSSLHRYLYASDSPVDLTDPSGLTPLSVFMIQLAARGIVMTARYYGTLVHSAIIADIEKQFPGVVYPEVSVPGGEVDVLIASGGLVHLYEIKPVGGTVDPKKQISRYLSALGSMYGGLPVIPGTLAISGDIRGPLLVERISYKSAGAGIIYYEPYFRTPNLTLSPVPVATVLTIALATHMLLTVLMAGRGPQNAFI